MRMMTLLRKRFKKKCGDRQTGWIEMDRGKQCDSLLLFISNVVRFRLPF